MLDALKEIKLYEWLTLAAIILGPIAAVFMTRYVDWRRERRAQRLHVFKVLMRTRGTKIHQEHVGALNLVEIEFYKEEKVSHALERYFQHLNTKATDEGWARTSDHLFTKLLSEMAKSLGYAIEQLQILTGGYTPQGWVDTEQRGVEIQKRMIALLKGEAALPVTAAAPANTNVTQVTITPPAGFPPAP